MNDTASALLSVLRDGAPDVFGALGLVLYLGSYLALQLGLIRGDGWVFPTFMLGASLSMILSLTARFNPFSMMVEVAWAVISVVGLIRLYIIYKYFHFTDGEQPPSDLCPDWQRTVSANCFRLASGAMCRRAMS